MHHPGHQRKAARQACGPGCVQRQAAKSKFSLSWFDRESAHPCTPRASVHRTQGPCDTERRLYLLMHAPRSELLHSNRSYSAAPNWGRRVLPTPDAEGDVALHPLFSPRSLGHPPDGTLINGTWISTEATRIMVISWLLPRRCQWNRTADCPSSLPAQIQQAPGSGVNPPQGKHETQNKKSHRKSAVRRWMVSP